MIYSKHIIVGNLTRDPELRNSKDGKPFCKMTVAVNTGWGERKTTTFFGVIMFGARAEAAAKHLQKGSPALFEGNQLTLNEWTDKEGKNRASIELLAEQFAFVGVASNSGGTKQEERPF